jgi:SAM-dependent methyltransferase
MKESETSSTDEEWERWGAIDPYFSVLTDQRYRATRITPDAKSEFFRSGAEYVGHILSLCRSHVGLDYAPRRVLDFGCGVGRLAIPFARTAEQVVGVDVSSSMLAEARRNCERNNVSNVVLLRSDDRLHLVDGHFDLVHSSIVLQHIPVERGRAIFERLVEKVSSNGVAAIQLTYGLEASSAAYGLPAPAAIESVAPPSLYRRLRSAMRYVLLGPNRKELDRPDVKAEISVDPEMLMNYYSFNELMFVMQRLGVAEFRAEFTNHGGALGAILIFRKP